MFLAITAACLLKCSANLMPKTETKMKDVRIEIACDCVPSDCVHPITNFVWVAIKLIMENKRLIDSNFDLSEIRKGRKPGTIVATIRNAPLKMPTIIIGLDD